MKALIERARDYVMTPEEVFEQRVSFVYGQLGEKNKLTKQEVADYLLHKHGRPAPDPATIRAKALEDAARVAESIGARDIFEDRRGFCRATGRDIATAIRALIKEPTS